MTSQFERLMFTAASAFDEPNERRAFIEYICEAYPEMRSSLAELFSLEPVADKLFEFQPKVDPVGWRSEKDDDERMGTQIGRYELITCIGQGGYGSVYLAKQEAPVRRRVALKIVKLGMDTEAVIARFEQERQALAQMDHPNIARVLDAGATAFGRPYFVMELVEGERITEFCDANHFGIAQRLELFIRVCRAVQHAHQKGVIHRDIKPSNILVHWQDNIPVPKIIDFGIAKAATESAPSGSITASSSNFIGTPVYMSPEQAMDSANVDTRCDIYSLGAMLYELVSGVTPFDSERLRVTAPEEVRRIIRDEEPVPPSAAFSAASPEVGAPIAAARGSDSRHLVTQLHGDLDWIIMRAMEKDRSRRYDTATGLAMELQRILNFEPVLARPPSHFYRVSKFARRNKVLFVAGSIAVLGLVVGFGATSWMFFRERAAHREADISRRGEAELRAEADARAQIAQAALLLDRDKLPEADQLVDKVHQIPVEEPSLEAARVFRSLAEWNVVQGHWAAAADRFSKLQQANQLDKTNTTSEMTGDLLGGGPAYVLAGEFADYRQFVQSTLARFKGTTDPTAAEQVIKNSLILPADPATLQGLIPFIKVVRESIPRDDADALKNSVLLSWRTSALGLYEYRAGNFSQAAYWAQKSMTYTDRTPTRQAMAHIVLAMAYVRQKMPGAAAMELDVVRPSLIARFPSGTVKISDLESGDIGLWHDWVIAYLLLAEADRLIAGK